MLLRVSFGPYITNAVMTRSFHILEVNLNTGKLELPDRCLPMPASTSRMCIPPLFPPNFTSSCPVRQVSNGRHFIGVAPFLHYFLSSLQYVSTIALGLEDLPYCR